MNSNGKLLLRRPGIAKGWEDEEKSSYDVETLRKEYRERLYSEKALQLLKSRQQGGQDTSKNEK